MVGNLAAADGLVYVNDEKGTLHAVSAASGKQVWQRTGAYGGVYGVTVAGGVAAVGAGDLGCRRPT